MTTLHSENTFFVMENKPNYSLTSQQAHVANTLVLLDSLGYILGQL